MIIMLAAALTLVACMKPNPFAQVAGQAEGDGDGDGDSSDGDSDDGDSSDGDSDDGDPVPDFASDEGQSCASLDGFSTACATCMAQSCCGPAALCVDAESCECLAACVIDGGSSGACKNECGIKPNEVPEVALLLACTDDACAPEC